MCNFAAVRSLLSGAAVGLDLKTVRCEGIEDTDVPLTLHLTYRLRRQLIAGRGGLVGSMPVTWERLQLTYDHVDHRVSSFTLRSPQVVKGQTVMRFAAGLQPDFEPTSQVINERFCRGSVTTKVDGDSVRQDYEVSVSVGKYSAADYQGFRDSLENALETCARPIAVLDAAKGQARVGAKSP